MANGLAAALGLDVQAHGDDAASLMLTKMVRRGSDPRPAFKRVSEELRMAETQWYASRGDGTWPQLQEATLENKQRKGQPSEVLVATGALRKSLINRRAAGSVRSATKRQMKYGTKVYYGAFHARGDHVPVRRPLLPVDQHVRRRMADDVRKYIVHGETR